MPKVSVIIPTFNRADCVTEAIHSVQVQTEQDSEILIVDDGSTDDTGRVLKSLAAADSRIQCYTKPNSGPAGARNFGLAKASGQFLAFLDSDDLWPSEYLTTMITALESRPEFGAAYAQIAKGHQDGRIDPVYKKPKGHSGSIAAELFARGFIWTPAAVFRRETWEGLFFDEVLNRSSEDSDFFLRLSLRTQWIFVPKVQVVIRVRRDSISRQEGVNPNRLLSLERWYFRLGGNQEISRSAASRKLSHACRKLAVHSQKNHHRTAALYYYRKAIRYCPTDLRLYPGWFRSWLFRKDPANSPWLPPMPLRDPCEIWYTKGRAT
jgi:glycosyltransferase involved in cell wall biosynthesis